MMTESEILAGVLQGLAARKIMAWRNNTGSLPAGGGRRVRFGLPGSADIIGILPTGRFLAIECKTAYGVLSSKQTAFQRAVLRCNGCYIISRDVVQTLDAVDDLLF